jgi:hypothetical protein
MSTDERSLIPHEVLDEILSMFGTICLSEAVRRRMNDAEIFLLLIDQYRERWQEYVSEVRRSEDRPVVDEQRYVVYIDYTTRWTYIATDEELPKRDERYTYPKATLLWYELPE